MVPVAPTQFRVLFVDDDNRGRAPALERILRCQLARKRIGPEVIRVTSAGLDAVDGLDMNPEAAAEVRRQGADADHFVTRSLSKAMLDVADVVVTGTPEQLETLIARFPQVKRRAFTAGQVAGLYDLDFRLAPLREHPAILDQMRESHSIPEEFTLPPWEQMDERVRVLGDLISTMAAWVVSIWAALVPRPVELEATPGSRRVVVDAFGVVVGVELNGADSADLAARMLRAWSRCLLPDDAPVEVAIAVTVDDSWDVREAAREEGRLAFHNVDHAMHFLTSTITVRAIESRMGGPVMLHAAGLASPSGDVVGFVAPSGTGKTTLSRTLGAHYGYVTDETLVIEESGAVLAYPKPLSVIVDEGAGVKVQWGPERLDLVPTPPGPLRLVRLVILERDPSAGEPSLEEVPLLHGLAEVASQVSALSQLPHRLHTLADLVESVGGLQRLRYRESRDLIGFMPTLLKEAAR